MHSQYTPFTCVLDVFCPFLRELGFDVYPHHILTHHRDILYRSAPQSEKFGAVLPKLFPTLAERYLLGVEEHPINDVSKVAELIGAGRGVFVFCDRFEGNNHRHAIRIVGIEHDLYVIDCPAFPHAKRRKESFQTLIIDWAGTAFNVGPNWA